MCMILRRCCARALWVPHLLLPRRALLSLSGNASKFDTPLVALHVEEKRFSACAQLSHP